MKEFSGEMGERVRGELGHWVEVVKVERADGVVMGVTAHDRDLTVEGIVYDADGGAGLSGVFERRGDLKDGRCEVEGVLNSARIVAEDIEAGLYDGAVVSLGMCDWERPDLGVVWLRRGVMGEVEVSGGRFRAALRGIADCLRQHVGEIYTPECRHVLGDEYCCVDLAARKVGGAVSDIVNGKCFGDATREETDGVFDGGVLRWVTGKNAGRCMDVAQWDARAKRFTLWLPMAKPIAVGDVYEVTPGCDKRFATCCSVFANAANFGGFPHLAGLARILQYPESS